MWDEDSAWICTVSWSLFCSNAPMQIGKNNQLRVAGWVGHEFAQCKWGSDGQLAWGAYGGLVCMWDEDPA